MKSTFKTAIFSALIGGTALVSVASVAQAGGFAVREQSAEGQGASFAGIAAGGSDLSSMFFNPATITLHEGVNIEGNAALILPYSKAKNGINLLPAPLPPGTLGSTNSGNIGKTALVPSTYASYQYNDNLFLGFTANSPFGLITKGNRAWAGSAKGTISDVFMLQAGPTVGYKVNDMFSVAASVRGVYSKVYLEQNASLLLPAGQAKLKGDDWSVNYSVGILIQPTETTRIGVGYNSQTNLEYKGSIHFTNFPLTALNGRIKAKLTTPGTLNVGVRQELGDFTMMLGFEWAQWSKLKNLHAKYTAGGTASFTDFSWNDSYYYSIGGEYKLSDATTLRAGFAYEDSPVPNSTRGVRVPDANRYWLSFGASHQLNDRLKFSLGYTHIFANDGKVDLPATTTAAGLRATFKQHVDIINVSGSYKLY